MTTAWVQSCPLGPLRIEVSGTGVRSIDIGAGNGSGGIPDRAVADALDRYFAGDLAAVSEIDVDLDGLPPFRRAVLDALSHLPLGEVTTYGALAAEAGRPGASRAVGQAVGANPVPIVVPCHRVLAADGSLGGYSGGLDVKRRLLAHEGLAVPAGGWRSRRAPLVAG